MSSLNNVQYPLPLSQQWIFTIVSFFLVAFGQPAFLPLNGLLAGSLGYALFSRVLLAYPHSTQRFKRGTFWFGAVQLVQLSWFLSHPFWYIYLVYFFLCALFGMQFGVIAIFVKTDTFSKTHLRAVILNVLAISALWTIFEWMRLFLLSGLSWNPIGLAITGNIYALQLASIGGIYLLSFWVIMGNLIALWAWMQKKISAAVIWLVLITFPYAYGMVQVAYHDKMSLDATTQLSTVLVQTAFAPEEIEGHSNRKGMIGKVMDEWRTILEALKKHEGSAIDLIVLPEFVVPFGTYSDMFSLVHVKKIFFEVLGENSLTALPSLQHPFFSLQKTHEGPQIFVNNAFWAQAIGNYFHSDILIGLEDAEDNAEGQRQYFSSAIFIHPNHVGGVTKDFKAERYAKRVLVPMGEYIPFEFCKKLAESYGIFGSFTCGDEAKVMVSKGITFSPSICYEETYGNVIREGRQQGAQLLINLTSDAWFPDSKLPKQHFDHARLRTVENGAPLARACNTGITTVIDSLGREVAVLGGNHPEKVEWVSDSLFVNVPIYSYDTLYTRFGDSLIIGICGTILACYFLFRS